MHFLALAKRRCKPPVTMSLTEVNYNWLHLVHDTDRDQPKTCPGAILKKTPRKAHVQQNKARADKVIETIPIEYVRAPIGFQQNLELMKIKNLMHPSILIDQEMQIM